MDIKTLIDWAYNKVHDKGGQIVIHGDNAVTYMIYAKDDGIHVEVI